MTLERLPCVRTTYTFYPSNTSHLCAAELSFVQRTGTPRHHREITTFISLSIKESICYLPRNTVRSTHISSRVQRRQKLAQTGKRWFRCVLQQKSSGRLVNLRTAPAPFTLDPGCPLIPRCVFRASRFHPSRALETRFYRQDIRRHMVLSSRTQSDIQVNMCQRDIECAPENSSAQ